METLRPQLLILARVPDSFSVLFGISLLERLLRIVLRLGFREAIILSESDRSVATIANGWMTGRLHYCKDVNEAIALRSNR
jgi:hypothetical protein